jgi:hypothetical protein
MRGDGRGQAVMVDLSCHLHRSQLCHGVPSTLDTMLSSVPSQQEQGPPTPVLSTQGHYGVQTQDL